MISIIHLLWKINKKNGQRIDIRGREGQAQYIQGLAPVDWIVYFSHGDTREVRRAGSVDAKRPRIVTRGRSKISSIA
jgi:hypothetical protein